MKLKTYDGKNIGSFKRAQVPAIYISKKSGTFDFNAPAVAFLRLVKDAQIKIHQDQDEPENWYIERVNSDGIKMRPKKNAANLLFSSTSLAKEIMNSVEATGKSGRLLIAGQATVFEKRQFFGLITTMLK